MLKLKFMGAARTVTGSKYLVDTGRTRVLVDDGLFQGNKANRLRNWEAFPEPPESIDHVVLTHAHLDHSGCLPRLIKNGFDGPVHVTRGTAELLHVLLPDSARIQEEDARYANRKGFTKHAPALPLYTTEDVDVALSRLRVHKYHSKIQLSDDVSVEWLPTGHIVGAAMVLMTVRQPGRERRILFSGDLGPYDVPVMVDPDDPPRADVLLIESTYGNRDHPEGDPADELERLITRTLARGGRVLIPAFAVGRAQKMVYMVNRLMDQGRIPVVPVVVDSPMASKATEILRRHVEDQDEELRAWATRYGNPFSSDRVKLINTASESKAFCKRAEQAIIISSSGMLTGGRVLHYVKDIAPHKENMLIFAGYQAEGTRGRRILEGEPSVKIHGQQWPIRAEVHHIPGLSAHADRTDLIRWMKVLASPPEATYVIHGEEDASLAFAEQIQSELGWSATVPTLYDEVEL